MWTLARGEPVIRWMIPILDIPVRVVVSKLLAAVILVVALVCSPG